LRLMIALVGAFGGAFIGTPFDGPDGPTMVRGEAVSLSRRSGAAVRCGL